MKRDVIVKQFQVGSYRLNSYLVACPKTRKAVVIDPAGDEKKIIDGIRREDVQVEYILNTHGHADHVVSNTKLKILLAVSVCMHEEDDRFFSVKENRRATEKELGLPPPEPADIRLKDGDKLKLGNLVIKVIHTPGHTPGSVCYLIHGNLFTGDTLFVGDVGRTDLTGGSLGVLLESLERKIIVLPPETIVWPGHDYGETPTSTIAWEMKENPYITDFILSE